MTNAAAANGQQSIDESDPVAEGRIITVTVDKPAHGGTFVARHDGRVVFVRGAAPGETVVAQLLPDSTTNARFWRAEAVEVIEESPDRVPSAWPESGFEGIGGADFAHIRLEAQRRIKTEVLHELVSRGRLNSPVIEDIQVEPAQGDHTGLGWRTRVRFAVAGSKVGMRGWRSHEVRPVGSNPLAHPRIQALGLGEWQAPLGVEAIDAVAPSAGDCAIIVRADRKLSLEELKLPQASERAQIVLVVNGQRPEILRGSEVVFERVGEHLYELFAGGFWQIHVGAPELLTNAVVALAAPATGDSVWDLYGGAGLFSVPLAAAVGAAGELVSVEGSGRASQDAGKNLAAYPYARTECADVREFVARQRASKPQVVVMDPPRAGVGEDVMAALCDMVEKRIVYVSCEPSTLVRDLRIAEGKGWRVSEFRAYDLYPHTHHMECVVLLERG